MFSNRIIQCFGWESVNLTPDFIITGKFTPLYDDLRNNEFPVAMKLGLHTLQHFGAGPLLRGARGYALSHERCDHTELLYNTSIRPLRPSPDRLQTFINITLSTMALKGSVWSRSCDLT